MKSTGVVRRIDELGRVVVPSELRRVFSLREGDELEISVDGERIILQKRQDVCLFCSANDPEVEFKERRICRTCASEFLQENLPRQAATAFRHLRPQPLL
jgi:AbrB family transcriptional regulator, transcriptional pleiotropic regulator of transition state genes